jgi:indole-3-glycerol phosphate synthase
MHSILEKIIVDKKEEVRQLRKTGVAPVRSGTPPCRRDFISPLATDERLGIIAEVKKASPSKGVIRSDFDPETIARSYEYAGADCISVLTDEKYFQGSLQYLIRVRETVGLPVLRKDFIIDILQVEETAACGADAMLLIAAALDDVQLRDLYQAAGELGVQTLIEIHNHRELERVMQCEPVLIGINNRDLETFKTDITVTLELIKAIPRKIPVVSESGIHSPEQAQELRRAGVSALLVGESLMRRDDPASLLQSLAGGG